MKNISTPRVAVVTGAARSLGLGIASQMIEDGYAVVMVDRDPLVVSVAAELSARGADVSASLVDLADEAQIAEFVSRIETERGGCDVLVNNAGINLDKRDGEKLFLEEVGNESWELMMAINLRAPFLLCRGFVPGMKRKGWGRVINITSRAGRTYVAASNVHYSASKAGLIGMTRMLAGECGAHGITANCVAPGRIESEISARQSADIVAASLQAIPVARIGTPAEIGAAVAFLASDAAGYITGATLDVNGGAFMG